MTLPLVAIGMLTSNSEESIKKVMDSVYDIDYPKKSLFLVFLDNSSSDKTFDFIREFVQNHREEYKSIIIEKVTMNIPQARNECLNYAETAHYVFFIDSDIVVPPKALLCLLENFKNESKVGLAALPYFLYLPLFPDERKRTFLPLFFERVFHAPSGPSKAYTVGLGCTLIPLHVVKDVGLFNERLDIHEDREYCYRVRRAGYTIICNWSYKASHLKTYKGKGLRTSLRESLRYFYYSAQFRMELIRRRSLIDIFRYILAFLLMASVVVTILHFNEASLIFLIGVITASLILNGRNSWIDNGIKMQGFYRILGATLLMIAGVIEGLCGILIPFRRIWLKVRKDTKRKGQNRKDSAKPV